MTTTRTEPREAAPARTDRIDQWSPRASQLGWAVVVLGTALRLRQYLYDRSLWRDEGSLVYNILHRGYGGLTRPLSFEQGSPPGFLFAEKAVSQTLGRSELALRLLPLLASVAALAIVLILVRRHLDALAGLLTLALCALSPSLVYYASEVKQYSTDVLAVLAVLWAGSSAWRRDLDTRGCAVLAAVGGLAMFASHGALFVLAPVGVVLAWGPVRARRTDQIARLVAVAVAWGLVLAGLYVSFDRNLDQNSFLRTFWAQAFLPIPPTDRVGLARWSTSLTTLFGMLGGINGLTVLLAPLAAIGIVVLWRTRPAVLAVVLGPWVVVVVASSRHLYPATERLVLFLVPLLALLVGVGTAQLYRWIRPRAEMLAIVVVALVLVLDAAVSLHRLAQPVQIEELRPLLTDMQADFRPGDAIYVNQTAVPAFDYYRPGLHLPPARIVQGTADATDVGALRREIAPLDHLHRVWLLASAYWQPTGHILPAVTQAMSQVGHLQTRFDAQGSSVSLYVMDDPGG